MPVEFTQLWVATNTADVSSFAGTDDPIAVIVNQDRVDKVYHTVADTPRTALYTGGTNIYQIPVDGSGLESTIDPADGTYCWIALRGPNAWLPEHVFIWGVDPGDIDPLYILLALRFNIDQWISSERSEGPVSFPVHRVAVGDLDTPIHSLVLLIETSGHVAEAGTNNRIRLCITTQAGTEVVNHITGDSPGPDLEPNVANFYQFTPLALFARNELDKNSITLEIMGDDQWSPSRLFLFGVEFAMNNVDVESVVPLVHVEDWAGSSLPLILSTDPTEGEAGVILPLVL